MSKFTLFVVDTDAFIFFIKFLCNIGVNSPQIETYDPTSTPSDALMKESFFQMVPVQAFRTGQEQNDFIEQSDLKSIFFNFLPIKIRFVDS